MAVPSSEPRQALSVWRKSYTGDETGVSLELMQLPPDLALPQTDVLAVRAGDREAVRLERDRSRTARVAVGLELGQFLPVAEFAIVTQ